MVGPAGAGFEFFVGPLLEAHGFERLDVGRPAELVLRALDHRYGRDLGRGYEVNIGEAVGIIGAEENPANSMYYGVLAIGILGTAIARGQAPGMARTMVVMVLAMALVPMAALGAGWTGTTGLALTYLFTAMVCAAWLASAWLFKRAS